MTREIILLSLDEKPGRETNLCASILAGRLEREKIISITDGPQDPFLTLVCMGCEHFAKGIRPSVVDSSPIVQRAGLEIAYLDDDVLGRKFNIRCEGLAEGSIREAQCAHQAGNRHVLIFADLD